MMQQITGIRIYSQNINGLSKQKFLQIRQIYTQYDIILLQETHLTLGMTQTYNSTLQSQGWRTYWGPAKRKNKRPQGGVAIWIKESLFSTKVILSCRKLSHSRSSHILSLDIRCQDQRFVLSTVYMPIQNNREAVDECISILHHLAVQNTVIWCGDFNFIEDKRDTTSRTAPRKSYTYRKWNQVIGYQTVCEASQQRLRALKAYTHEAATTRQQEQPTRSRLDRIYCSSAYRHMITTVHVHSQPRVHSDHLPISTNIKLVCPRLRQQQRGTKQQRRNCIPQQFLNNPAYKERYCQEMQEWLHQLVESTPRIDYSTWLTIKKHIAGLAIQLNREYRAGIQQQIRQNQQDAQVTEDSLDLNYLHKADAHIMLPSPSKDLTIPGLVQPTGRITESAVECANILVDQYAAVSAQPPCSPWAQQYLLHRIAKATSPLQISTLQYADDNTVPLSLAQIERFIDAMDIFAAGTGQHLNKSKTWLLPIGAPTGQPTAIKGLRVVPSATILGIKLQANSGLATFDWAPRLQSLETYCKLLAAQLSSSFTKFSRLSTYKLPQELYRAEISAAADSLTWIRTLWHKLFTDYQLKQSGVAPQTLTAALPCLQPPEVQPQWQRRGETIPLEDYTVKFGTLLLTEGQQADRNYRWQQWLEIIQDKRMSDSQECLFQHPIRWRPLYRVLPPLSRLPIPSAYKIAFWETIMRTGITSERIKVDQPCICHFSPVQPGRAHFFYHCPIALSLCSNLFQVDLQAAQDILRSIWM
ncbi:hypothetical protein PSENEW3n2_00003951, partial [Picochlorum sp. SENEW3]